MTAAPPEGLLGGALFRDYSNFCHVHQYGGAQLPPSDNSSVQIITSNIPDELWTFDLLDQGWTKKTSNAEPASNFGFSQHGTYVQALDQPLAVHFDVLGMTIVNTSSMAVRHVATNCPPDGKVRVGGQVQYIPDVGSEGVLVVFGGTWTPVNQTNSTIFDDLVITSCNRHAKL
jgi:hypothetical protein